MTPETFIKAQIAAFAFQEAAALGSVEPMLAVACVLRNRIKAGWYGGDWVEGLNCAGDVGALEPKAPAPLAITSQPFRKLLVAVEDIYAGTYADELTSGGLYYMNSLYDTQGSRLRGWFKDQILTQGQRHRRIAQVGMLWIFN